MLTVRDVLKIQAEIRKRGADAAEVVERHHEMDESLKEMSKSREFLWKEKYELKKAEKLNKIIKELEFHMEDNEDMVEGEDPENDEEI